MKLASVLGLAFGVAMLTSVVLGGNAVAQTTTCQSGCGAQMKACTQSARTTKLACKLDCRTNAAATDLRGCVRDCVDTFRSAKDTCRGDLPLCVESCAPAAPPDGSGGCLAACGQDLSACGQDVLTQAKGCVRDCSSAPDRLGCLQACATTAQDGADTCASNFTSCVSACGVPPSGAPVN